MARIKSVLWLPDCPLVIAREAGDGRVWYEVVSRLDFYMDDVSWGSVDGH